MSKTVRAAIYFDASLHRALRLKAASTHRSVSELVVDAVREALRDDADDFAAIAHRAAEPSMTYEAFHKKLKANGTLRLDVKTTR